MKNLEVVKRVLRQYYTKHGLPEIEQLERREIAIGEKSDKPVQRHLSFARHEDFLEFLQQKVPLSVHHSLAYYEAPWAPSTENKRLLSADLVLELDPDLQFESFAELLGYLKERALALVEVLESELGIKKYELWFSGNKGLHVYIKDKEYQELDPAGRLQVYFLFSLKNIQEENFLRTVEEKLLYLQTNPKIIFSAPELRFLKQLLRYLIKNFENLELINKWLAQEKLDKEAGKYRLQKMEKELYRNYLVVCRKIRTAWLRELGKEVLRAARFPLDRQVIVDRTHLVRYPGSLNVKGGFIKCRIEKHKIEEFNPFEEAVPVKDGKVLVEVKDKEKWKYYGISAAKNYVFLEANEAFVLICTGGAQYVRGELHV